jgi:outer membrane protein insertion porin family
VGPSVLIAAALAAALPWAAVPVSNVIVDAPGARDVAELRSVFGVAPGSALSRTEIRRGVQALLATGEVEDVVVVADPGDDGVTLTVRVQVALRLDRLDVVGLSDKPKRVVSEALELPLGAPLRLADFEQRLALAETTLRDEQGYPGAVLEPELAFDVAAGDVTVRVHGRLGPPRLLRDVAVAGAEIDRAELWKVCGLEEGQRLGSGSIVGARRRLAEYLRRQGRWEAEVDPPELVPRADGVGLLLRARLGPRYRLEPDGIKPDKALAREALLFLSGEEPFEEVALDTYVRRTRHYLQRQGRLLADVTMAVREGEEGERVLSLVARRTGKTRIEEVRLLGDLPVPTAELAARIGVHEGGMLRRLTAEPVDEDTLADDTDSVVATLRALGYAEARVSPARIVEAGGGVAIEFAVDPGRRTLTGAVEVIGFPATVAVPTLPLVTGGPWSAEALADSRAALATALDNAGYLEGEVTESHECADQRCDVRFDARPGTAITIDRVVISGLGRTSRAVVTRVLDLEPGRVAGLDAVLAAQRRLSALGIFERVNLRPIPGQTGGDRRGVVVDVAEGKTRAFGFGIGWNSEDSLRGSLNWAEANLLGTGRGLAVELRGSSREQFVQASVRESENLGLLPVPAWFSLFYQREVHADYSVTRHGAWLEFGNRLRRPLRALLRYDYSIIGNDAPPEIQSDLEREEQDLALSSLTPILEWDTRDDLFSPRRGVLVSAQLLSSFDFLGADASLDRLILAFAGFAPLGRSVLAASLRTGGINPRDPCEDPCPTDNLRVPIATRFYAGGRVTHRAFPTDGLGTPEVFDPEGRPIGGGGQLIANFEWRFPLFSVIGGHAFVDAGNVWPNWRDIDPAALRWGAGLGLRVDTPVGPFRLEYGWKLDREPGESPGEWFFSFGNPF